VRHSRLSSTAKFAGVGSSPNNYVTLKVTVWKYVS